MTDIIQPLLTAWADMDATSRAEAWAHYDQAVERALPMQGELQAMVETHLAPFGFTGDILRRLYA